MSSLRKTHPDFDEMRSRWEMCGDLAEGEYAVHKAGVKYLPKLQDEEDDAYALRLRMTPVFNAFWRTIVGMRGMLFRKPPTVVASPKLLKLLDDIDLAGTSAAGLAQEVVEEGLKFGRIGLLVDHPVSTPGATLADAQRLQLRPFISVYEAPSIYNWRETCTNGVVTLTQVRLKEKATLSDAEDEFEQKSEDRWRVLDLFDGKYRQRVFRLLAIVADRLRSFRQGPFASRYNALALTHIEDAQNWLNRRTLERMRRGVEGTHKA